MYYLYLLQSESARITQPVIFVGKTVRFSGKTKCDYTYLSVTAGRVRRLQRVLGKYTYLLHPLRQLPNKPCCRKATGSTL